MTRSPRRALLALAAAAIAATAVGPTIAASAQDGGDLTEALGMLGIAQEVASDLVAGSLVDGSGDTFRYAVPGSRPATLDEGYVDIQRVGAAEVHWTAAATMDCGARNGALVVCAGEGPDLSEPHAVFWMQVGGELPTSPELSASLAFPVLTDGGAPWVAQGPFQWDTFQGTDRWHDLGIRPDTDWEIVVQRFTGDDVIVEPTDAFAVVHGTAFVMAVPLHELEPLAEGVGSHAAHDPADGPQVTLAAAQADTSDAPSPFEHPWRWASALHFHDGTFGSSPSDTSGVDSHPDTDTDTPRGPDQLATPTSDPVIAQPAPTDGPTDRPSDEPTDATDTPSSTPDDDGGVPWVPIILGGLILVGGGIFIGTRPRQPAAAGCDCQANVTIEGPSSLGRCCIAPSTFSLQGVEDNAAEEAQRDPSKVHVDGDDDNGHDVVDAIFSGTINAQCSGGGTPRVADATWDWSITSDDDGFDLTVTVHVPVDCPGQQEHPGIDATATHRVDFHEAPCIIGVIIEQVGVFEISHVDVQIVCGEYSEVFGYFPTGGRTFANTIAGAPGQVIRTSGSRAKTGRIGLTTGVSDEIGSDYVTSHGKKKLKVYWIEPEDCSVCSRLRDFWENLASNPGTYYLLDNNCATSVWQSLTDSGAFPAPLRPQDAPTTPGGIEARLRLDHEGGGGHVNDVSEIR